MYVLWLILSYCNYMYAMLESWQHSCSAGQGLYCLQQEGFQSGSGLLQESSQNQPKLSRLVHHSASPLLGSACEEVYVPLKMCGAGIGANFFCAIIC